MRHFSFLLVKRLSGIIGRREAVETTRRMVYGLYAPLSHTGRIVPKAPARAEISAEGVSFEAAQCSRLTRFSLWLGACIVRETWNRRS